MKTVFAAAAVGLGLMGAITAVSAQPYGGRDYGYRDRDDYRGRDDGYRSRDDGYRDRDDRYGDRGDRYRDRGAVGRSYGFDEQEYLRCNPDVLRAIRNGQMQSGAAHYKVFGRREGRKLTC